MSKILITETALRDSHQSLAATRMTTEEMLPILADMDKVGYHSLEAWGGATFDACMRFLNEDPWERLRTIKKHMPKTKLQMLFRGQNILGYRHYSDDVVEYFVQKSIANGIDIIRIFDALNDPRNLKTAINATIKEGGHVQAAFSYTTGAVYTLDYYAKYAKQLEEMGIRSHAIAMDDYFLSVDPATAPRNREGQIDYESPFCLDMELLNRHFAMLDRGEKIEIPKFEFARQMRSAVRSKPLQLGNDEIAIFEGIHALNDIFAGKNPNAMKVYISARSNVLDEEGKVAFKGTWMRLERRTVRDAKFRAMDAERTIRLWAGVRRGEKLYISPFKDNANIQFDSSLPYEVCAVKPFAQPLFHQLHMEPGMERYEEIGHLVEAYPKFETLDEKYIAADSLIREFIGGGIYDS